MSDATGLVYIGKIVELSAIQDADFIMSCTVVCGKGGTWKGIIKKGELTLNKKCIVFLPDSLLPHIEPLNFMEKRQWRVGMCHFKGSPSEVLVMPILSLFRDEGFCQVGDDITYLLKVTKYQKPVPSHLSCDIKGAFPSFIPKTDEPNYQNMQGQEYINKLHGSPYYITEKLDGSSTTAYKHKGEFGLCSRNQELNVNEDSGYWKIARKYQLEDKLPEGIALQWETCGPKIQNNSMGLKEIEGFAFSGYNIAQNRYLNASEFIKLCESLKFPSCHIITKGKQFDMSKVSTLGEGTYSNGHQREGVVVRSVNNILGNKPVSFKVINLNYES